MMAIQAENFPEAYHETLWILRTCGVQEESRNGPVCSLGEPFFLTVRKPWQRVISCPVRNANPFFHVMETVWMFSAGRNCDWLEQFNKNVRNYANNGVIHGAYGHRWFQLWGDQVDRTINLLRLKPNTRQAVIQMWDAQSDHLPHWNDRPCNTQLMFRVFGEFLEMTVINRSNDLIWGMFGANCVHMSYLHEFIARAAGLKQGKYHVFSNNLHFYKNLYPNGNEIWDNLVERNLYPFHGTFPVLSLPENHWKMRAECFSFMLGYDNQVTLPWLNKVAKPMRDCYLAKTPGARIAHAGLIEDESWRTAALQWLERRYDNASE